MKITVIGNIIGGCSLLVMAVCIDKCAANDPMARPEIPRKKEKRKIILFEETEASNSHDQKDRL